ncbi:unnamed protein product [Calypogeia fissa]
MAGQWWWRDVLFRSLVLVCLASIMEQADEALLPSVYREIGIALHASPAKLGSLTLLRSITQASFAPVAGFLAQQYNRASIIAGGALMWAVATFFVGISSSFTQLSNGGPRFKQIGSMKLWTQIALAMSSDEVAISRALNGIGLAVVGPSIQSMLADSTDDHNRGRAFGWLGVAGKLGSILGGLVALILAETTIMGVAGWRMAFHLVALLSVVIGVLVYLYAVDPQYSTTEAAVLSREGKTFVEKLKDLYVDAKNVIQIRSFQIFVAQGVSGSFPWAALAFAALWLELVGFSHDVTAILMGCFVVATSLGNLLGGFLGDYLSTRLPDTGRIMLSQISAGSGIPLGAILLLALPSDPSTPVLHGAVFFLTGLMISWNGPATNGPIFAEIVPEKSRPNIYALDQAFEAVLASFAPPIVGLLAEHVYGYAPLKEGADELAVDKVNAVALAKALYTAVGIPFALCAVIYSGLYWTYPRDRDRVREMQPYIQEDAHIPLHEVIAKDEHIWTVGELDEDEDEDDDEHEYKDSNRQQMHNPITDVDNGISESETAQMLPKHESSL